MNEFCVPKCLVLVFIAGFLVVQGCAIFEPYDPGKYAYKKRKMMRCVEHTPDPSRFSSVEAKEVVREVIEKSFVRTFEQKFSQKMGTGSEQKVTVEDTHLLVASRFYRRRQYNELYVTKVIWDGFDINNVVVYRTTRLSLSKDVTIDIPGLRYTLMRSTGKRKQVSRGPVQFRATPEDAVRFLDAMASLQKAAIQRAGTPSDPK